MCQKKEMTRVWSNGKMMPVTVLSLVDQEVVRYKTQEKDWYDAVVLGLSKKEKNGKTTFSSMVEFHIDNDFSEKYAAGSKLDETLFSDIDTVSVVSISKGKGFQGAMKRFGLKGWPKTHGSKFHRQVWSLGNRKPRRVQKGHPHAGQMGGDRVTLRDKAIIDRVDYNGEKLLLIKGSVPGGYNSMIQVVL